MSGEILAILAVGVALAGVILTSNRGLRMDMAQMESRLDKRISGLESRISGLESRISGLESHIGELRERMAHLEGLLVGLREAITGRVKAG